MNDNNATTPEAAIAAIKSFPDHKGKIVLIGGGTDKVLDFSEYCQIIPDYVKSLILFTGTATDKIMELLPKDMSVTVVSSMAEAWQNALKQAEAGDLIMLSPGAASFGVFNNEYERNDQFVGLFNEI